MRVRIARVLLIATASVLPQATWVQATWAQAASAQAASAQAASAQTRGTYKVTGAGTATCSDFLAAMDVGRDPLPFAHWVTGFLAGASWPEARPGTRLDITVELDTVVPFLRKWCMQNPRERVGLGAAALYQDIRQRALLDGVGKAIEKEERLNQRDRNATSRP